MLTVANAQCTTKPRSERVPGAESFTSHAALPTRPTVLLPVPVLLGSFGPDPPEASAGCRRTSSLDDWVSGCLLYEEERGSYLISAAIDFESPITLIALIHAG